MSSVTFKQAFELARQLSPEDQQLLAELLAEQFEPDPDEGLTLKAEIVARLEADEKAKSAGIKPRYFTLDEAMRELGLDSE
jgi:hypothetical protein